MKMFVLLAALLMGVYFLQQRKEKMAQEALQAQLVVPTPVPTKAPKQEYQICTQHKWCSVLREYEKKCSTEGGLRNCKAFTNAFKKLSGNAGCIRRRDNKPVPSLWICDDDPEEYSFPKLSERAIETLAKLKTKDAVAFYYSEAFRRTLYSYLKEKHHQRSLDGLKKSKKD